MRWLLVLLVGAGVVAMHSLADLGGCSDGVPLNAAAMSPPTMATGENGSHSGAGFGGPGSYLGGQARGEARMRGVVVVPNGPEMSGGTPPTAPAGRRGSSMLGHLCLAVLDALGLLLLVLLSLAAGYRTAPGPVESRRAEGTGQSRAPPSDRPPNRPSLTGLCISRR
jgi:hypothetical protein